MNSDLEFPLTENVARFVDETDSDLWVYSGDLIDSKAVEFVRGISKYERRETASLFLTTYGGDPDAAYRIARCLRDNYKKVRLLVVGPCKSAGTLLAVGADELSFGPLGELGPLDMQIRKPDELLNRMSGLDTIQAFDGMARRAFATFEEMMLSIHGKSYGIISTRMACEVASSLVCGIFQPIAGQIDPHRLGEVDRQIEIAEAYGLRLATKNLRDETLSHLINHYPSHGFIIDQREAAWLFHNVNDLTELEAELAKELWESVGSARRQHPIVIDFAELAARQLLTEEGGEDGGHEEATEPDKAGAGVENGGPKDKPQTRTSQSPEPTTEEANK